MRAKEFLFKEAQPGLADVLKAAITAAQPKQTTTNPNQKGTAQGTQGTIGSQSASQATTGGTQTPQDGVDEIPSTQQPKGPGVIGSFIKGATSGQSDSMGSLAASGATKALKSIGMGQTAGAITKAMGQPNIPAGIDPKVAATTLKPGTELSIPQLGKVKVNKITPQGIELDTSHAPSIGVKNVTVDLKSLAKK